MSNHFLQIDVSDSISETEEDLIDINLSNNEVLQVNFSKLVSQSKFIRDKYKYAEAVNSIPSEIEYLKEKYNISSNGIKFFIQLIQDQKSRIPIENYKDVYILSKHFLIQKFTKKLDKIGCEELFNDLDFTIQILSDSETATSETDTELMIKIENFLSERINECIKNSKFNQLPICTICRILERSRKETVNQDLVVDFISVSAKTRLHHI